MTDLETPYTLFSDPRPEVSVVIPMFNEVDNVPLMLTALHKALQELTHEIILVDDGSTDGTIARARQTKVPFVRIVELMRNYGQTSAMAAGIAEARGEYVVTLDGDLQNDPADIPLMLDKARREDWDVVAGRRANRQDGWLLRKIPSRLANAMIRRLTGVYLYDYGCTLKVFRRTIALNLGLHGELHRFIPVLADIQGARMTEMDVRHHARRFGTSKYGLGRTTKVLSDLILMVYFQRWMKKPMHLFGPLGGSLLLGGGGILLFQFMALFGVVSSSGVALLAGILLTISGILFLVLGILAEIQMRIYYERQHKTPYSVRKIHEVSSQPQPQFQ
jgi:glycosyltransferase involved in cell wall biosynthesis